MRLIMTTLALALLSTAAMAQQPLAPTGPTEYMLKISPEELNALGRGLDELPAKIANPISQRLVKQIEAQNEAFRKAHQQAEAPPQEPPK